MSLTYLLAAVLQVGSQIPAPPSAEPLPPSTIWPEMSLAVEPSGKTFTGDGSTTTQTVTNGQTELKVEADVKNRLTVTCADATARAALAPAFIGQKLSQLDTVEGFVGTGLTAGDWAPDIGSRYSDALIVTMPSQLTTTLKTLYIDDTITLTGNLTCSVSSRLVFGPQGKIVTNGNNLQIRGAVHAPRDQQIFEVTAPGEVTGALGGVDRHIEWWGAQSSAVGVYTYAETNWIAIQSAIECTVYGPSVTSANAVWTAGLSAIKGWRLKSATTTTVYKCYVAHTTDAAKEPGVGVDWEDYWVEYGTTTLKRGTLSCRVRIPQYTVDEGEFYIDRPLDLRNHRTRLLGPDGCCYPLKALRAAPSAFWALPENMEWPPDFPNGTQCMIRLGSTMITRDTYYTELKSESQYDTGIEGMQISTLTDQEMTAIWYEGSLEENSRFSRLIVGATNYAIGGSANTHTNGLVIDRCTLFGRRDNGNNPVPFMMAGYGWSMRNCTLNMTGTGTGNYCARVGGKEFTMEEIHMENAQVAGIDVVYEGINKPPNGCLTAIEGYNFSATAPIVRINHDSATINCLNIKREQDDGPIIEDLNTGLSTDGSSDRMDLTYADVTVGHYFTRANEEGAMLGVNVQTENMDLQLPRMETGISAAGTTQANATELGHEYNVVSNVTATSAEGVKLFAVRKNRRQVVKNAHATDTLKVYPASGDDLGAGPNAAVNLTAGSTAEFMGKDTTTWEQF